MRCSVLSLAVVLIAGCGDAGAGEIIILQPAPPAVVSSHTETAGSADQLPLRAVSPQNEAERMRLRARQYVVEPAKPPLRPCPAVSNQIGTIGDGTGSQRSETHVESGGSFVNSQCR